MHEVFICDTQQQKITSFEYLLRSNYWTEAKLSKVYIVEKKLAHLWISLLRMRLKKSPFKTKCISVNRRGICFKWGNRQMLIEAVCWIGSICPSPPTYFLSSSFLGGWSSWLTSWAPLLLDGLSTWGAPAGNGGEESEAGTLFQYPISSPARIPEDWLGHGLTTFSKQLPSSVNAFPSCPFSALVW